MNTVRRSALSLGLISATMLVGGAAVAAVTDTPTITACTSSSGIVRTLGESVSCKKEEVVVTWGAQGPQGDPGPAASVTYSGQVLDGPFLTQEMIDEVLNTAGMNPTVNRTASCPTGTQVINAYPADGVLDVALNGYTFRVESDAYHLQAGEFSTRTVTLICLG